MENTTKKECSIDNLTTKIKAAQSLASNPKVSTWVNAHAGTGKTKVLVDRILRILLTQVPHSQILCITYTQAAIAEINTRVMDTLSKWSYIDPQSLIQELHNIGVENITPKIIQTAQNLCNQILDSNQNLKIYTIHSFCKSILEKFFLEANLNPNFKFLNNDDYVFMTLKKDLLNNTLLYLNNTSEINLKTIFLHENIQSIESFIDVVIADINEFLLLKQQYGNNISDFKKIIYNFFNVDMKLNSSQYKTSICTNEAFDYEEFISLVNNLHSSPYCYTKTDSATLTKLTAWLNLTPVERSINFDKWVNIFFTQKMVPRVSVFNTKIVTTFPIIKELVNKETKRLASIIELYTNLHLAEVNFELFKLAFYILDNYIQQKQLLNAVDYEDLIYKTFILLKKEQFLPWVFYKLNEQISHILLDEAQDTSPLQWEIIKTITQVIFNNTERDKSIFIVGDLKQSIYSFRGAHPLIIPGIKETIKNLVINTGSKWEEITLNTSFRSSQAVLNLVNLTSKHLFSLSPVHSKEDLLHHCYKKELKGKVEIWPIVCSNGEQKNHHRYSLANAVANKIIHLVKKENIEPKDIMVLYNRRSNNITLNNIIKILEENNIPTSGVDKFSLISHLAIRDIISLVKFIQQPLYNLNLATLLKSPLFNLTDTDLISLLANKNQAFLWHTLQNNNQFKSVVDSLLKWQSIARNTTSLFELFSVLLYEENICNIYLQYFGPEIIDLLTQFLNIVINYENTVPYPTLEHFLNYIEYINPKISKSLHQQSNEIKFLTIHGSKGLESKIVFLIDNTSNNDKAKFIKTNSNLLTFMFRLSKTLYGNKSLLYSNIINKHESLQEEENKRLLYVALTRAQKDLYICASTKDFNKIDAYFYNYINNSLPSNIEKKEDAFFSTEKYSFINNLVTIIQ